MGIKFLCPNGHKLNVKSFLKGKKAICPKCGARVLVPDESQDTASQESSDEHVADAGLALAAANEPTTVASSVRGAANRSAADSAPPHTATAVASAAPLAAAAVAPAASPDVQPSVDPIGEAPTAVWYVRPATGGQFGPASGEIMRGWINEGRVGASSLVWRAGWPEWRAASAVFPALGKLLASPVASAAVQVAAARPVAAAVIAHQPALPAEQGTMPSGSALPPVAQSLRKRRRKNDQMLILSGVLLLITLVLVAVLVIVWQNQAGGVAEEQPAAVEATSGLPPSTQAMPISHWG
jgi:hypothetical protein